MKMASVKAVLFITFVCIVLLSGCSSQNSAPAIMASSTTTSEEPGESVKESEPDPVEMAVLAYAAFLEGDTRAVFEDARSTKYAKYALIHLDDDDIPELALAYDNAHPEGVSIYTFDGTDVVYVYSTGSFGRALYERYSGVMFGFYSGMGNTYTRIGIVKNCDLQEETNLRITDIAMALMDDTLSGYKFYREEEDQITQEEYEEILSPYLPENRQYQILDYEFLPSVDDVADMETALRDSLKQEIDIPYADAEWYYEYAVYPHKSDIDVEKALELIQGIWTSAGHSQSESWIIEDRMIREYMAIWDKDMYGPTDEYELQRESLIESIEPVDGMWEGEFIVRLMDSGLYYVYKESENETMLECHWDEAGYSMTDSMIKDYDKRADGFPKPIESVESTYEPTIDISRCTSFENIIDMLEDGRGYARVRLNGDDILLVSNSTFFDGNCITASDAEVYGYVNGSLKYIGYVASDGTAYPLSIQGDMLICAADNWIAKFTVYNNNLFPVVHIREVFDASGKANSFYKIGNVEERESYGDGTFRSYLEDYTDANVVEFETSG